LINNNNININNNINNNTYI